MGSIVEAYHFFNRLFWAVLDIFDNTVLMEKNVFQKADPQGSELKETN